MTPQEKRFESEVQKVARKRNGDVIDANLFWDIAIALDTDSTKRHEESIKVIEALHVDLDDHLKDDVRMKRPEFEEFIGGFRKMHADRDLLVQQGQRDLERLEEDIVAMQENCAALHPSATPQRGMSPLGRDYADPSDAQFGEHRETAFPEDTDYSDMKRFWRFGKWALAAFVLIFIDMFARYLSHTLFGYPS
jgi:hypothetical protein